MTGTDECHNSCSHSGTLTWGDNPVSQHPGGFGEGHGHSPAPIPYPPPLDPFQHIAAEHGDLSKYIFLED